jgi:hypothetical protein
MMAKHVNLAVNIPIGPPLPHRPPALGTFLHIGALQFEKLSAGKRSRRRGGLGIDRQGCQAAARFGPHRPDKIALPAVALRPSPDGAFRDAVDFSEHRENRDASPIRVLNCLPVDPKPPSHRTGLASVFAGTNSAEELYSELLAR